MGNSNLIIADPHAVLRIGLRTVLEERDDVRVVGEAVDGISAIDLVRELRPDMAILELNLPDVDGVDVTRRIVSERPGMRVIGWSTNLCGGLVRSFLDAGGAGLVRKWGPVDSLHTAVDAVLEGQVYMDDETSRELTAARSGNGDATGRRPLTAREREVLRLLTEGNSTREVAARLFLSVKTIESHRKNIMDKLNLRSVAALTKYAVREGITTLGS